MRYKSFKVSGITGRGPITVMTCWLRLSHRHDRSFRNQWKDWAQLSRPVSGRIWCYWPYVALILVLHRDRFFAHASKIVCNKNFKCCYSSSWMKSFYFFFNLRKDVWKISSFYDLLLYQISRVFFNIFSLQYWYKILTLLHGSLM